MFVNDKYSWYIRIVNIVLIIVVIFSLVKACQSSNTPTEVLTELPKPHPVETVTIVDSLIGVKQEIRVVQDKKLLKTIDSLATLLSKNAKVDPQIVIKYNQVVQQNKLIGTYADSLSKLIDQNISDQEKLAFYNKNKDNFVLAPTKYKVDTKWLKQVGTILPKGQISIDSSITLTEPFLTIGETSKWFQKSKLGITIGDHNPGVQISNLQSYQYVPKPKRFGITIGPTAIASPKGLTYGVGITAGYTIHLK